MLLPKVTGPKAYEAVVANDADVAVAANDALKAYEALVTNDGASVM